MNVKRTAVLLLAAWLVLLAGSVASPDESNAERWYRSRLAAVERAAAARLWDSADRARKESLFRFARREAERVLEFDPEHRMARAFLGFVKRPEGWAVDTDARSSLPGENRPPPGGGKLEDAESEWRRRVAVRAEADVAAIFAAFGDECVSKGRRTEADAAFTTALLLDPQCAAARKGLSHLKFGEGLWLTPEERRVFEAARIVRPLAEASRYDEVLGATLAKAESGHYRVESPHAQTVIAGYLEACERAHAAYLADLALPPSRSIYPRTPLFCVLETDAQWNRWVDRIVQPENRGFWRDLTCHTATDRWACALRNYEGSTDQTRRDRLAHETVHMLNRGLWSLPIGCWLDDALACRYPPLLDGTTMAFCMAPRKEDYAQGGAGRAWTDYAQWRPLLKEMAAKRDDLALRAIVTKSAYDLPMSASIKAWSVVDFLLRRDRAAFVAMLGEVKGSKDPVLLLETRFGRAAEVLDEEWRRWVADTY